MSSLALSRWTTFALLLLVPTARGDDQWRLRGRALDAYSSLIESIDTFECKGEITVRRDGQPAVKYKSVYVRRSGDELFILSDATGRVIDKVAHTGATVRYQSLDPATGQTKRCSVRPYDWTLHDFDPWTELRFRRFQRLTHMIRQAGGQLAGLGATAEEHAAAGPADWRGVRLTTSDEMRVSVDEFDARYNYLLVSARNEFRPGKGPQVETATRLTRVADAGNGIFLPGELESVVVDRKSGRETDRRNLTLTNVRVNRRVDPTAVALPFPAGTVVYDYVRNQAYTVDGAGAIVGPVRSLPTPLGTPVGGKK